MLQEVHHTLNNLGEKYPEIKPNLDKCFKDIQAKCAGEQATSKQERKKKIQDLLRKSMDMTRLQITYEGLVDEIALDEDALIQLVKKLSEAISSAKKKTTTFAARQGKLLADGKRYLSPQKFKHVRESCGFASSYANFLISLHKLMEEYPRLSYCAVAIRTFMANMKVIRGICEEEPDFWKNVS